MIKLLKSELKRLFKNKFYFLSVTGIIIFNFFPPYDLCELYPFQYLAFYASYTAFFTILFVGRIFRERTCLNLISSGVKKTHLYLSELIVSAVISLSFTLPVLLTFATSKECFYHYNNVGYHTTMGFYLKRLYNFGPTMWASFFMLFAIVLLLVLFSASIGVFLSMTLHSDIKAAAVFAIILIPMFLFSYINTELRVSELPYIPDANAVEAIEEKLINHEIDLFDPSDIDDMEEFSSLPRNRDYIRGVKGDILRALNSSVIGVHISRIMQAGVNIMNCGEISVPATLDHPYNFSPDYSIYAYVELRTPLEVIKAFHMEYCVAAVMILNLFGFALFRKSNLS